MDPSETKGTPRRCWICLEEEGEASIPVTNSQLPLHAEASSLNNLPPAIPDDPTSTRPSTSANAQQKFPFKIRSVLATDDSTSIRRLVRPKPSHRWIRACTCSIRDVHYDCLSSYIETMKDRSSRRTDVQPVQSSDDISVSCPSCRTPFLIESTPSAQYSRSILLTAKQFLRILRTLQLLIIQCAILLAFAHFLVLYGYAIMRAAFGSKVMNRLLSKHYTLAPIHVDFVGQDGYIFMLLSILYVWISSFTILQWLPPCLAFFLFSKDKEVSFGLLIIGLVAYLASFTYLVYWQRYYSIRHIVKWVVHGNTPPSSSNGPLGTSSAPENAVAMRERQRTAQLFTIMKRSIQDPNAYLHFLQLSLDTNTSFWADLAPSSYLLQLTVYSKTGNETHEDHFLVEFRRMDVILALIYNRSRSNLFRQQRVSRSRSRRPTRRADATPQNPNTTNSRPVELFSSPSVQSSPTDEPTTSTDVPPVATFLSSSMDRSDSNEPLSSLSIPMNVDTSEVPLTGEPSTLSPTVSTSLNSAISEPSAVGQNQGTNDPSYQSVRARRSHHVHQITHICAHRPYRNWSPEELRLRDYELGRRTAPASPAAESTSANTNSTDSADTPLSFDIAINVINVFNHVVAELLHNLLLPFIGAFCGRFLIKPLISLPVFLIAYFCITSPWLPNLLHESSVLCTSLGRWVSCTEISNSFESFQHHLQQTYNNSNIWNSNATLTATFLNTNENQQDSLWAKLSGIYMDYSLLLSFVPEYIFTILGVWFWVEYRNLVLRKVRVFQSEQQSFVVHEYDTPDS